MDVNLREFRVGKIGINKFGSKMVIEKYNRSVDIWVKFLEHGNLVHTSWYHFVRGDVKNPYDKSIYGVGFIGDGKFKTKDNGKSTLHYHKWFDMLKRCYDERFHEKQPTYKDCEVYREWHNFQNFAKWHTENYYTIEDEVMCLDKDILNKGNKIYSPETCIYAPKSINSFFMSRRKSKDNLPYGISKYKDDYVARIRDKNKEHIYLGRFKTLEEAFLKYKNYKEKIIKDMAESYKGKIPLKLYEALVNYSVDIND